MMVSFEQVVYLGEDTHLALQEGRFRARGGDEASSSERPKDHSVGFQLRHLG